MYFLYFEKVYKVFSSSFFVTREDVDAKKKLENLFEFKFCLARKFAQAMEDVSAGLSFR